MAEINEVCQLQIQESVILSGDIQTDSPVKQEEEKLFESAILEECDVKIDLPTDVLFDANNAEQTDVLCSTSADNVDTSKQSSEISELECGVEFLHESAEQTIDSPLLLSPEISQDVVDENSEHSKSCLFLPETEVCQETLELAEELEEMTPNSIAMSEAEIISEAAELESERKLKIAEKLTKSSESIVKIDAAKESRLESDSELSKGLLTTSASSAWQRKLEDNITAFTSETSENSQIPTLSTSMKKSETIPKSSIPEERLKEPPEIEIPIPEISPRIMDVPITPKTSSLIQRDSEIDTKTMYQKMLDSPKSERMEPKIFDTPRKDLDEHDFDEDMAEIDEVCKLQIEESIILSENIEIDSPMRQEGEKLIEPAILEECDVNIDLPTDVIFDANNAEQTDVLCSTSADNVDTSKQSSEISELGCAAKFLQESEEQTIDFPLLLTPKISQDIVDENSEHSKSRLFLPQTKVCQETSELTEESEEMTPNSIAMSEAEIISEAAKLDSECKLKIAEELTKSSESIVKIDAAEESRLESDSELSKGLLTTSESSAWQRKLEDNITAFTSETSENSQIPKLSTSTKKSETIPKSSILEERLKEPPEIEIPIPEISPRIMDIPTTAKTSSLIQRDSRTDTKTMYQKMLDSPKSERMEPEISDTLRKDLDKHDFDENMAEIDEICKPQMEESIILSEDIEIDSPMKQEEEKLIESAILEECDVNIDLPTDVLFDTNDAEQTDLLCSTSADNVDMSQQSSEISELECAVKLLQESEEQTIDSPLLLSPQISQDIVDENSEHSKSCLFSPESEDCQETLELAEITPNSMAFSEADIISEAAKLESERKLKIAEKLTKSSESRVEIDAAEESRLESNSELLKGLLTTSESSAWQRKLEDNIAAFTSETSENSQIPKLSTSMRKSETIPESSILEERLKEPPEIEIPIPEISPRIMDIPTTPKTSSLIQRDSRTDTETMYQKMLDSPKSERMEPEISYTLRKDLDKHDFDENMVEIDEVCKLQIEESMILSDDIEIDSPMKQEEEKLIESAILEECDVNIDLPTDVLFDTNDAEQTDVLCSTSADNVDTSQQCSEISELECAVKFLPESEEQTIDSPLLLSPKISQDVVDENSERDKSCLFLPETKVCQKTSELTEELEEITPNSTAMSKAEIISEAAELESERKLKIAEKLTKSSESIVKIDAAEESRLESNSELSKGLLTTSESSAWRRKLEDNIAAFTSEPSENSQIPKLSTSTKKSETIPKSSILEERLKEPPEIEIPIPEISPRIIDVPTTPKTSSLIQRDSRTDTETMFQKMLDPPKSERMEAKISDTSKKDLDKHNFDENMAEIDEVCKLQIEENLILSEDIEIDSPMKQEEEKLIEPAILEECDVNIDLPTDVLFDANNAEQTDVLCSTSADNVDTSQQSSEISELECAVKFLQESEEQTIDSPLLLSPKISQDIVDENSEHSKSCLFLPETEVRQESLELAEELEEITLNSMATSEAEIISEAAKLESERKQKIAKELTKSSESIVKIDAAKESRLESDSELLKGLLTTSGSSAWQRKLEDNIATFTSETSENSQIPKLSTSMKKSETIPKSSILEERLKEPPEIEIPIPEISPRIMDIPTTAKTSSLIQRDSKTDTKTMYPKMLDSPKSERMESIISDTPRKDLDKHDSDENMTEIDEICKLQIEENLILNEGIEIDSPMKQEEEKLIEPAILGECDVNIDLPTDVLFDANNAEQTDVLCSTSADNVDTSQQSSEISELECAVKFLQESEEQTIDSPLLLSPKISQDIVDENSEHSKSCLFLPETEVCQETLQLAEMTPNSMAYSEAEIISEAAKLESERKQKIAEKLTKSSESIVKIDAAEESRLESDSELLKGLLTTSGSSTWQRKLEDNIAAFTSETLENSQIPKLWTSIRKSETIPKSSILEERLKEPPEIEIPIPEISPRIMDVPTTPKTSLLIQRDSRTDTKTMYQKMLDSPKSERIEPKISDTPRKDVDKHDFENVGSPRIILKIAKSAIADCGEPRSPKSPKIRSAANSPNPEDSPGQKLGKIKLKLSRGGHPSIIPNDNFDESAQRHTEAILSPSHIGMKIKLSKTGDASIIQPDKHDSSDEIKESKHKFDEVSPKRIESPLGMKIKFSKTGDPSIVQQDAKDSTQKRKEKLDIGQEIPKRTDSPIGMKIKLSKSGDASIIQPDRQETSEDTGHKEKFDSENPKRTDSPISVKIKLSKSGDTSILSSKSCEEFKDASTKSRDKLSANQDIPKRTESPLGMKFKITKSGEASIIQPEKLEALEEFKEKSENVADMTKRVESPIGMKIKLLKTGDASIIHPEKQEQDEYKESVSTKHREKSELQDFHKRTDSPIGMRIKVMKSGEASVLPLEVSHDCQESLSPNNENFESTYDIPKRNESPIGMKIKLSKSGDASIIHPEKPEFFDESKDNAGSSRGNVISSQEGVKVSESPLGMKIKLSKTGDASIIHPESKDSQIKRIEKLLEFPKRTESPLGMKINLSKTGDASIIEPEKKEKPMHKQKEKLASAQETSHKRKETEFPIEMKIKLSKTGHPTIIANEKQESVSETHFKSKVHFDGGQSTHQTRMDPMSPVKDPQLRIFKSGHSTIIQSSRSEVTIEPIQMSKHQKPESSLDIPSKCNDVTISPVDANKSKLEAKLSQILPEVSIQPVMSGESKQIMIEKKSGSISQQQMSVINQEISITQVSPTKPADLSMSGKLKEILRKNATNSPANSDCEIIEHRPELIIVNENSNSSQDIMIIEEVKVPLQEVKVPRKRGRPKRSSLPIGQTLIRQIMPKSPLAVGSMQQPNVAEHRESDRPKRTCRNQKSYAPPKRGRGRGRGKRKMDRADCAIGKIPRLEDPLTEIERSTLSLMIAPLQPRIVPEETAQTSELYKALKRSPAERKRLISENLAKQGFPDGHKKLRLETESDKQLASVQTVERDTVEQAIAGSSVEGSITDSKAAMISGMLQLSEPVPGVLSAHKLIGEPKTDIQEEKNMISEMATTEHQNWLTPSIKLPETTGKSEAISMVQVMDEETRMSAESNSRSQTPARNISVPAVETVINEESQGSVLSTATTESEKVKVKNRRMEINFDPDEGPFTVDKIAEYEWPLDQKGDTFMIQEQISQYLGVKSFKRKYPDLKRRMVEMEERNYLRENGLVSEAMCDMGLTAICSTEVLDVMCSDFPDQYEEYRKHMREKQAKEHSKKQKELTAAANAERNRIDLAEMAVQSALSWNVNFNKARKESRKYSLDLQSFTIHVPKKQLKVDVDKKPSNYPVALIPGQYTDYYREYTPAELRYYPLNTVLYGPMRPNERKFDSQSEGSQSDSDSDSSSDDSSSSSSEGTQDTEESQSTIDEVEIEAAANNKEDNKNLKCKMCLKHLNKHGKAEVLIQCGTCNGNVHPSCIDLTLDMVPHIQGYSWQCTDCKTCVQCHNPADEDKMLFCDMCDRGYHIYCVGLRRVPQGRWHCRECAVCASCGLKQPGGANSDRNSVAQWQHEYKKGERNTRVYVSTLCVPCSKLWRKGRYCPHCSRCHSAQRLDLEPNLVHCGTCDKYLHLGCVEIRYGTIDRKNYICECCSTPNQQQSRSLISKSMKT